MGVEHNGTAVEPEKSPDTEQPADRSPPPDRPGELGAPSRAESRRVAMEANEGRKPKDTPTTAQESSGQRETDEQTSPENGETETTPPDSTEQRRTDRETDSPSDSFEQRPSYGNFDNLAEEFDARAKSREQANELNSGPEESKPDDKPQSYDFKVDDKSLREHIDPEVDDINAAGNVESKPELAGDRTATGIEEGENDRRSKLERLRGVGYKNAEDVLDRAPNGINKTAGLFERPPTGSHAVVATDRPAVEVPHQGINAGETTTAVLATGIVIGELARRVHDKLKERGDK